MIFKRRKTPLSTFWELNSSSYEQNCIPFTHRCFEPNFVEIGSVFLEEKIFKFRQCIFTISWLSPLGEGQVFFIWTNLNPLHPRMLCAKFDWNQRSGSGEEDILISSIYFRYFVIISPWKRAGPFIWINLNSLYPRMHCAKFDIGSVVLEKKIF